MSATQSGHKKKDLVLRFRITEEEAQQLQQIADVETEGNLSMVIRTTLREKIERTQRAA